MEQLPDISLDEPIKTVETSCSSCKYLSGINLLITLDKEVKKHVSKMSPLFVVNAGYAHTVHTKASVADSPFVFDQKEAVTHLVFIQSCEILLYQVKC